MYLSIPLVENPSSSAWMPYSSSSSEAPSLNDCLDLFCREELLTNENQWYCSKCKEHVDATKKIDLWTLPPILIVHLKRFKHHNNNNNHESSSWMSSSRKNLHDGRRSRVSKLNNKIDIPLQDWKPSIARNKTNHNDDDASVSSLESAPATTSSPSYNLYAVSNHYGGYGSGHYDAHAINRMDDEWYEFNDATTKKITEEQVKSNSDAAYLLFYNQSENTKSIRTSTPNTTVINNTDNNTNNNNKNINKNKNNNNNNNNNANTNNKEDNASSSKSKITTPHDKYNDNGDNENNKNNDMFHESDSVVSSSSSLSRKSWSDRVPIIYKQSISRPENWPHLQNEDHDDNGKL